MYINFNKLHRYTLFLLPVIFPGGTAYGANSDGARELGPDYAFLVLMTLSPDFAAANYTVTNEDGTSVDISIARLPYNFDLIQNKVSRLQLEIAAAYQRTREVIPTFTAPEENIEAEWNTYGGSLGLLYEYNFTEQLRFTPSVRIGLAKLENHANYNGVLTNLIKDQLDGIALNWNTNASILNLGLGLSYNWKLLDRTSSIKADVYHAIVDTFDESSDAVKFTEAGNMLAVKADMIFPTGLNVHGERLDLVLLLGAHEIFGENRDTLGYTTSYQTGIGTEFPLRWKQTRYGHLRLSGQVIWANNMKGWLLSLGYNSE
jgi:hypothetical protein